MRVRMTRVEVIGPEGRDYLIWAEDNDVTYQIQDGGKTLKVFVSKLPQQHNDSEVDHPD